ncbi:mannose-1-phosphate guanylyltransferase [Fodinibius salsisoli]|uniref:Mannose-1-phosphate guanylyltransferase n=1 Tax=Fodinibius salsisoli TaxID=2820877 RepID=A0ABT3PIZ9_9BACT|nr:mannose-1-phosphate guanylyltransferase [Fodinibius salsisoli]MCW9705748.1 mannose-1-phosphate guanylyltransferase [Fodinibius salsisoli]
MLHAVIMAGGSGTRFWPRSTQEHPKQFLNLFGDRTMLQKTVDRIEELIPAERTWVITNERYEDLVHEQLPDVPLQNIVGEPMPKNTAPCVALAAALIHDQDPDGTMVVLPADHLIEDTETFLAVLETAQAKAKAGENLITVGIEPGHPETGYGYIEFDKDSSGIYAGREVKKVHQFREKPDKEKAQEFLDSGNFLWNSGMFVWTTSTILKEFDRFQPEIKKEADKLQNSVGTDSQDEAINTFYQNCPSISIDYGIMESSNNVFVVPGSFGWNDVGSWKAVYELRSKDENKNVIETETAALTNAGGNLIQSKSGKMIALVGVENLAVVETDDAILVCNLNEAQGVKQIVNQLKENEETKRFL